MCGMSDLWINWCRSINFITGLNTSKKNGASRESQSGKFPIQAAGLIRLLNAFMRSWRHQFWWWNRQKNTPVQKTDKGSQSYAYQASVNINVLVSFGRNKTNHQFEITSLLRWFGLQISNISHHLNRLNPSESGCGESSSIMYWPFGRF